MERQPTDEELARKARDGDAGAFDALVVRHFGLVHAIALGRTGRRETAEEVAQEVFLRLHLRLGELRDPRAFGGWMRRVARSVAADAARLEKRRAFLAPTIAIDQEALDVADETVGGAIEDADAENRLREVLAQIPEDERELVLLHYSEGMTKREISERLGVDATTVGRRLAKAVESLRARFGDDPLRGAAVLRPRRAATVRTVAVVAAAAALPEAARAALVASAAASSPSSAPAAAGGISSLFSALLSSASQTGSAAGAIVMGNAKAWTAAGVVGALAVGGGAVAYKRAAHNEVAPSPQAAVASVAPAPVVAATVTKSAEQPYLGEVPNILPPALGQDPLAGCWMGVLEAKPGRTIGFVVQVADTAPGKLEAAFYSHTHAIGLIKGTARRSQDGAVDILFPDISLTYKGRMTSEDRLEGSFTEVKYTYPMELERGTSLPRRMMPPARTAARLDDATLNACVGDFARSTASGMPVRRMGDHLVTQLENRPLDLPIYPLTADRFFSTEVDMLFEFERDASGKVVRMAFVNDASATGDRTWYRKVR